MPRPIIRLSRRAYDITIASTDGGDIGSSAGVHVASIALRSLTITNADTVLVVGAGKPSVKEALADKSLSAWLPAAAKTAERYGSVCSGAFIVASAGLLDKREATTHWSGCRALAKAFPSAVINTDALYVIDRRLWTSAGVTTGIDMALAMVSKDHGTALMRTIAQWLVVYVHRPGNQSQFSPLLAAQMAGDGVFAALIIWIRDNLEKPLRLADMAEQVHMSERSFRRKFTRDIGQSPAKFLESVRLDKAKHLLEAHLSIATVALKVGFKSEAGFRKVFQRRFGITPSMYAAVHSDIAPKC